MIAGDLNKDTKLLRNRFMGIMLRDDQINEDHHKRLSLFLSAGSCFECNLAILLLFAQLLSAFKRLMVS